MNLGTMFWIMVAYGGAFFIAGFLTAVATYPSLTRRPKHGAGRGSPARKEVVYRGSNRPVRRR